MNASTRSRNPLVLSESSKTTTSPLTTAGEPILAHHPGRRNRFRFLGSVDLVVVMGRKAPRKIFLTPSFSLDALPACSPAQLEQAKASINANTRDANPEARNL